METCDQWRTLGIVPPRIEGHQISPMKDLLLCSEKGNAVGGGLHHRIRFFLFATP